MSTTNDSGLLFDEDHLVGPGEPSFRLTGLEIYNWGPFGGRHHCEFDADGSAIVGPTGSGKTTLVDALMTLLVQRPWYNLASTGGHEQDRDLISYVRGVSGAERAEGESDRTARPNKTMTGLAATYGSGRELVSIGVLFWVDSSSNAPEDLKRVWFFSKDMECPLYQLLQLLNDEGKKGVTRFARETVGLRTYPSKREYLAQVRDFFEVGENALSLLNRAAGLKQIQSIDDIFRQLVLDDHSVFDQAREVVGEFDTLQGIYQELQTARKQRDVLLPVRKIDDQLSRISSALDSLHEFRELLPLWFADAARALWQAEIERVSKEIVITQRQIDEARADAERRQRRVDQLNERYLRLGGATIQEMEARIAKQQQHLRQVQKRAEDYQACARNLGLPDGLESASFQANLATLESRTSTYQEELNQARNAAVSIESRLRDAREAKDALKEEYEAVKRRPTSNIPLRHKEFQEALAAQLGLCSTDIPFVAELIEVKPSEEVWRGAIERAIGSERLRILVPEELEQHALQWVNERDNRLHVRLQRASPISYSANFFVDGFTRKLSFREGHPLRENVKHLLAKCDRHCVDSIEVLRRTEHAMTVEGTMSGRAGGFEKQDQKPLDDDWMTGFTNESRLKSLADQACALESTLSRLEDEARESANLEDVARARTMMVEEVRKLEFTEIDLPRAEEDLAALQEQLASLLDPGSDAAAAKRELDGARQELDAARAKYEKLIQSLGGLEKELTTAEEGLGRAGERLSAEVTEEQRQLAAQRFPQSGALSVKTIEGEERSATQRLDRELHEEEERKSETEQKLISAMAKALAEDTGALAEVGTGLSDVPMYLERLAQLETEALPEKRRRFLEYLNQSSGQGVTQLLKQVENEVTEIEERVGDLNKTLMRVNFRGDQYLQLRPRRVGHESLRTLERAQRKLRSAALNDIDDDGETHYRALEEVIRLLREAVESRRTLGAQALLDPRYRLNFFVVEVDRATGHESGQRTGSQTGSGGEKEMMASYILTASLSYALCPPGATRPRYATIVLDEAFSKSSPAAATRIIEALREFCLHPLFVTPEKELGLLKQHTRSAILVYKKDKKASLTSLTWRQLEEHERGRLFPQ